VFVIKLRELELETLMHSFTTIHTGWRNKVLYFLRWATRIGYDRRDYEWYWSSDNFVEVGCTICDMPFGGLPRDEWEKLPKEAVYCDQCKQ